MKKILVLGGGDSPEKEVSWRSATFCLKMLQDGGFKAELVKYSGNTKQLDDFSPDEWIVFPILHGSGGEDGLVQSYLEEKGFKYLGSDSKSSKNCFDKKLAKKIILENDIPTPEGLTVNKEQYKNSALAQKPHVLKALTGGSSIGTAISKDGKLIAKDKLDEVFSFGEEALLEELIVGQESTVAVLGDKALSVVEIIPPEGQDFDLDNKYNGATQEISPPENIDTSVQEVLKELALKTHKVFGCRHLSRVDIMLDSDNKPYVLEINTIPGMTEQSLFPKAAAASGLDGQDLFRQLAKTVEAS